MSPSDSQAAPLLGPTQDRTRLLRFLIYNSAFGPREGEEHLKLVFYHPSEDDESRRAQNVGFAEASFNFCQVFHDPSSGETARCKLVSTRKTKTAFLSVDGDFVLSLTVSLPAVAARKKSSSQATPESPTAPSAAVTHLPENVHDGILLSCLQHSYDAFCFFTPTSSFSAVLSTHCGGDRDQFRDLLAAFFSRFVPTLRHRLERHGQLPCLTDLYRPVQFLSLQPADFLASQCFCGQLRDEFSQVAKLVLLQQGNLVWSDLQQEDTRLVYQYVIHTLLPSSSLPSGDVLSPVAAQRSPFGGHQGRFLAGGPSNLRGDLSSMEWTRPRVHLGEAADGDGSEHQMVVYHALCATVCLFVPAFHDDLPDEFFRHFDAVIGPRLANLSRDLLEATGTIRPSAMRSSASVSSFSQLPTSPSASSLLCSPVQEKTWQDLALLAPAAPSVNYFYFNHSNLAMKSTLGPDPDSSHQGPADAVNLSSAKMHHVLLDAAEHFEDSRKKGRTPVPLECCSKTSEDQWAVAKLSGERVVLAEVASKCSTLMDASEEVDKLVEQDFKNVFLLHN